MTPCAPVAAVCAVLLAVVSSSRAAAPLASPTVAVIRSAQIDVSAGLLNGAAAYSGALVPLALFDDAAFDVIVMQRRVLPSGGLLISGRLRDVPASSASMVVRDGRLTAAIHAGALGTYDIVPLETGDHLARQRDTSDVRAHCGLNAAMSISPLASAARSASRSTGVGLQCDDGSIIDVMVVYTAAARVAAGGVSQIENLIDIAVDDANQAFNRSGIDVTLNLVHSAEVGYAETGVWQTDGPRLVATDDGFLDEVHPLRDQYGADCVSLWVSSLNTGGIGYFPDTSLTGIGNSGFSMLRLDNATLLTFAHEIGHNLYCTHDRPNTSDIPFAEYAYGYTEPGNAWHTIMSVAAVPVIPYFANPDVDWPGPNPPNPGPTGVPDGQPDPCDIALTIDATRHIVANFRPTAFAAASSELRVAHDASLGGDGAAWATAFDTLDGAVCAAAGSAGAVHELWVKSGTYTPDGGTGERSATFGVSDGIAIYGGFSGTETVRDQRDPVANPTVLSGEIGVSRSVADNSHHVVTVTGTTGTSLLDGFIITGGNADGNDPDDGGAGVLVVAGGDATFANCTITQNMAARFGAGVYVRDGGSPTFTGCTISNNTVTGVTWPEGGGGVHNESNCTPTFTGCVISGNTARLGSGMADIAGSSPTIDGCLFENNVGSASAEGGAIYNYDTCSPVITGTTFAGNSARFGGAMYSYFNCAAKLTNCALRANVAEFDGGGLYNHTNSDVEITGCLFSGNSANFGGAMNNLFGSDVQLGSSTLVGNTATSVGGGVYNYESAPQLANTLLWSNAVGAFTGESEQIFNFNSTPALTHCSVQGWTGSLGGTANNGSDPQFADADGADDTFGTGDDDPRPLPGSPAIDTGDAAELPVGVLFDLDGRPRIAGPQIDRGAYEYSLFADGDGDGDIDLADHALLADCLSGPAAPPEPTPPATAQFCLVTFDADSDGDVDLADFASFASLLATP